MRRRVSLLLALAICVATPATAPALPGDRTERPVRCLQADYKSASLSVQLTASGLPLVGSSVQLSGTNAKYILVNSRSANCEPIFLSVPRFRWTLVASPAGSSLTGTGSLTPSLALAREGDHRVRFTACQGSCRVSVKGRGVTLPEASREIVVQAMDSIPMPPETEPVLPARSEKGPSRFDPAELDRYCQGGGGTVDPQWVTVGEFHGPANYRLLEGSVDDSRLAHVDYWGNHDSHDHLVRVVPDPPYGDLVSREPEFERKELLGVEWESNSWPGIMRPTPGDRVSIFGYWIHDCGHDPFYTEIHPPVGVATHRSRAITIPPSFQAPGYPRGLGSNVRVPGIQSDIWFSRNAGKMIGSSSSSCPQTGFHQPSPNGHDDGACITRPSLRSTFTFNVYLPRDPREIAAEAGRTAPPVALYVAIQRPEGGGSGGPDPTYRVCPCEDDPVEPGVRWLEVTVDLRSFTGDTYGRRLRAAWAYPSPDNWDARRWRVRLRSMDVHDDGDCCLAGDGDWRFLFNTNNAIQEWTKLYDCGGCIHGTETFGNAVQTGAGLGPDPIVFSGQDILVHTAGFDEDGIASDTGVGSVVRLISQAEAERVCRNSDCAYSTSSTGGDARYTLRYEVRPSTAVGGATLTPEGRSLYDAYLIRSGDRCSRLPSGACVVVPERLPAVAQDWHPRNMTLPTRRAVSARRLPLFARQEREEFVLTGISERRLARLLARTRRREPREYRRFLEETRRTLNAVPRRQRREAVPLLLTMKRLVSARAFRLLAPATMLDDLQAVQRDPKARD